MSRARVTPRAQRDIDAITDYSLATWGEAQTAKYLRQLAEKFSALAEHPHSGRARDEIAQGYRSFPFGAHVIFYVIQGADIAIIGVPHGAMDIEAHFDAPD